MTGIVGAGAASSGAPRPLFSIVTVTLDAGAALERTVASVAGQSFTDLEHIVKDGGSSDGSLDSLERVPRLRLLSAPDRGIYDAMNQALRVCRGRYVLFLNAGDLLAGPGALAAIAERVSRGGADLFYCDLANDPVPVRYPERLGRFFLFRSLLCHQACFFAASAYERVGGFDGRLRVAADYDFLLRALLRYGLHAEHLPVAVTVYEGGGFSAAAGNRSRLAEEQRSVRRRYFSRWEHLVFASILALTLRPLRIALVRSERFHGAWPLYQRVANAWNQLGAKADAP